MEDILQAQSEEWLDLKRHTPEKMALARLALEDIRDGMEVFEAIRRLMKEEEKSKGRIGFHP